MRLDKYLANMKVGSRKEVHKLLKEKRVLVDGQVVLSAKMQLAENANVQVDGKDISYQQYHYFLINKPQGVISATNDPKQKTVLSLLKEEDQYRNLAPVGRLDKDTTGFLLITNNGDLAHQLLSPKKHVEKVYEATVAGMVTEQTIKNFAQGIEMRNGTKFKPGKLELIDQDAEKGTSNVRITISEGKYHQIKRMFLSQSMEVLRLHRLAMGDFWLDESLDFGQYREVSEDEIKEHFGY